MLTLSSVRRGFIDTGARKLANFDVKDVSKYYIKTDDAFVVRGNGNKSFLGRIGFYTGDDIEIVYPDTLIRLRFDKELVLDEFMQYLWDSSFIRQQIEKKAKTTNGTHKINQKDIKSIEFPCPPIEIQQEFLDIIQTYLNCFEHHIDAEEVGQALFNSLLDRAFTGELTAEWEAANAEEITAKQKRYERLPQLVLLSFLRDKVQRSQQQVGQTVVLITALMKYTFLLQMEGIIKRRLYQFIPYHYGPFAKEVYNDLQVLQQEGLITISSTEQVSQGTIDLYP